MERRGDWIWRGRGISFGNIEPKVDQNLFVCFRRTFELREAPAAAPLRISVDGRYKLWVNDAYAGRGPARCEPLLQYYDEYDIAPHLRAGANVVAVLVHSYGRDMSWYELPRAHWSRQLGIGGLFVECDIGDSAQRIDSGASWRYAIAEAWERDTAPGAVGFTEIYDARREIAGWHRPAFDDSAWPHAVVLRAPGVGVAPDVVPFPTIIPRDIPLALETAERAARIASVREIAVDGTPDPVALAESRDVHALSGCRVINAEEIVSGIGGTEVRLAARRAVAVVLDFGGDVAGYPAFAAHGPAGAIVDVAYAERLRADGRVPVQRTNAISGQNVHRYVLRDGPQSWEKFERAGFRYLQLTFIPPADARDAVIRIERAGVTSTSYPVGSRGSFACSDDALTRIWRAGAYTLQLCMHDGFEDCPSREQRQWVGDAYIESLVNYACFGDTQLTAKLIRQVAQSQMRDGMTQMATPGDISARWPLYIVDYCLYWIMTVAEYVLHTGDQTAASGVWPSVVRAVDWFERHIGRDGLLVEPPGWIFIDWAEVDRRGASAALNALLVRALNDAATLADHERATAFATRWRSLAQRIAAALNARLWDAARGVYVDALLPDGPCRRVSQHTNAMLIAGGIAPSERWPRMFDYVMEDARLVATSTRAGIGGATTPLEEESNVVLAQPFFTHWLHRALVAAGRDEQLLDNIRARWSPMLTGHARDTLWEHWHGDDSRCHAWSATPTYDLSREVLGVRPLAPGFAKFAVAPSLAGLSWAEGCYPTVRGDIPVSWHRADDRFALEFEAPAGAEAEVLLPPGMRDVHAPAGAVGEAYPSGRIVVGFGPGACRVDAHVAD